MTLFSSSLCARPPQVQMSTRISHFPEFLQSGKNVLQKQSGKKKSAVPFGFSPQSPPYEEKRQREQKLEPF